MKCLEGKVAIVTGSGQGIGRGIAIGLARAGAKVVTNNRKKGSFSSQAYDRSTMPAEDYEMVMRLKGDAETTAAQIREEGGEAVPCYGDVAIAKDAKRLIQTAIDTWGRIDIIVNNAAGMGTGSVEELDDETWDKLMITKTKGAFHMMHYAIPYMKEQGFGRIFNGSSTAWLGLPGNAAYAAANAAVVALSWTAAQELFRYGITVNAYCPEGESPAHAVEFNKMIRHIKTITGEDPNPAILQEVENDHADPVNLGPIFAYLSTEKAGHVSGEVFRLRSSGKIDRFSMPESIAHLEREKDAGFMWDVEELDEKFKETILGEGYVSIADKNAWAKSNC